MSADHDRMEDAVAAYALDACDDEERELVRAHIVACPSCRALARRLSQAVDALPLATDEVRPPDRLRARILSAAATTPQAPDSEPPSPRIVPLPLPGPQERRRRRRIPAYWAAVAALVMGLVALGAWNVTLNQRLNGELARYPVVGTGTMSGASGTVIASQQQAVLALSGMPEPPAGKVYEVWLIDGAGRTTSAGTFRPTADGTARVGIDHSLVNVSTVAVTQEDGPGGASAPTQKPELAGQIG
ncbi:MAG TPA: anti-sigma factor [Candidatus Dormibacteraeota bacterium]|jgi:anti-sigma-K factor RskA